jgi:hypothetical protein
VIVVTGKEVKGSSNGWGSSWSPEIDVDRLEWFAGSDVGSRSGKTRSFALDAS